jgi:hypothetical protein
MEKEKGDGWKDVKKKPVKKSEKPDSSTNITGNTSTNGCDVNNFSDYYNPSVKNCKTPISNSSNTNNNSSSNNSNSTPSTISQKKPRYVPLNIVEKKLSNAISSNNGSNSNNSSNNNNNTNVLKYQPPSIKSNTNGNRGGDVKPGRGGRGGGKWGKRFDVSSIPDFENDEEKMKYTELQKVCPHIVMPGTARRDAVLIRIDNYAEKMLSDEWIEFQCSGWKFIRIIKPDDTDFEIPDEGFELLNLENKYNDFALFQNIG